MQADNDFSNLPEQGSFGRYLLEQGILTREQWQLVELERKATGRRVSQVVSSLGFVSHETLVASLLAFGSIEFFEEERYSSAVAANLLLQTSTMVVADIDSVLYLATLQDAEQVRAVVANAVGGRQLKFVPCSVDRLQRYLTRLQDSSRPELLLDRLLQKAAQLKVSDIHFVPKEASYLVMFRYLGVRYPEYEGTLQEFAHLSSRIKDLARLDLAERRRPQDGAFSFPYEARNLDFRVATVPTLHGEYLVLRLLDPETVAPSVESLGITRLSRWKAGLTRPDGLCLVCGPTGSGKTTTLNASVKSLDRFGSAVFTVEDPVEGHIPLVGQVNVNPSLGLDFSRALKAFMRADPDVIVLGEIRDADTARNALRAAETGHLVLATLHTESIMGAAQRLRDLGVPPSELVHLLRAVLVQRLVRVVCAHCHGSGKDAEGSACSHCSGYGFTGRTVVSECEYFPDSAAVSKMLDGQQWWPSLLSDAQSKAGEGITTPQELSRLFGVEANVQLRAELRIEEPLATPAPSKSTDLNTAANPGESLTDFGHRAPSPPVISTVVWPKVGQSS